MRSGRRGGEPVSPTAIAVNIGEQDDAQQFGSDERKDSALRDNDIAEQLVELFVVANRELQVARDDPTKQGGMQTAYLPHQCTHSPLLLIVPCGVPRELKDFSGEILEDGSEVHRRAGADTPGVLAMLQETM